MAATHRSKVLILGSGPAGYTAAIYAARASLKPMLVQGIQPGGQLTITTDVENYPGFADVIQGPWLMEQMQAQAEHVGTELFFDTIVEVDLGRRPFLCVGDSGDRYECRRADHLDRRHGQVARPAQRGDVPRRRRFGLRDLRRLLLPRQGSGRGGRRQHGGRGSALSHPPRLQGDPDPSPRFLPRREDPAGPPVQEPQGHGAVGPYGAGDTGRGQACAAGQGRARAQRQDRRWSRSSPPTGCSSPSAIRPTPSCSRASSPWTARAT